MPELGETKKVKFKTPNSACITSFIWHGCVDCGKERWVALTNGKPKSIRCPSCAIKFAWQRRREKFAATNWEGKKRRMQNGSVMIKLYPKSFFYSMTTKEGYIQEHRLVMAKQVKRCLLPWEVVHHKNGVRDDNRTENLELITDKRFHLVDSVTKGHIVRLNKRIEKLELQVKLLQWRLNEREKTNVQEVL